MSWKGFLRVVQRLDMLSEIAACAFAMVAVSVFGQEASTKPDNTPHTAPVAQAQKPHRARVEEDVQKAKLVHMVYPVYPPASNKRLDGTVVLHVVVGKSGDVKSARYVSGPTRLVNSAVNAVLQWRYKPTLINHVPVEVDTTVTLVFPPPEKLGPPFANK